MRRVESSSEASFMVKYGWFMRDIKASIVEEPAQGVEIQGLKPQN